MYNEIIFVDFENVTQITEDIKKKNAKIIILVGFNQTKKSFPFANELLENVFSVELLKVKGQGKNALDFFIAYYLGVYTNRNKKLRFTVYSNDKGYDPLIKHLKEIGINIERLGTESEKNIVKKESEIKNTPKVIRQSKLFETEKDYKKAFDNIKNIIAPKRPRKLKGFETLVKSFFHETVKAEKINAIINEFKRCKYIEIVENDKITYNNI